MPLYLDYVNSEPADLDANMHRWHHSTPPLTFAIMVAHPGAMPWVSPNGSTAPLPSVGNQPLAGSSARNSDLTCFEDLASSHGPSTETIFALNGEHLILEWFLNRDG